MAIAIDDDDDDNDFLLVKIREEKIGCLICMKEIV